ncbi:TPA: hypothetical protein ACGFAK_004592 [Serratia marcescens]|uniref:hypothetical protein n=1 Tax=Serratia TaxID=613 RepID=UPI001021BE7F|nr:MULTISPECIES: hypothetical protein [Serratia]MBP1133498.1 putative transcriptional regulator of viral defense system [Serratia sp. PL17]RYM67375.1 hypothetical protein BSQ99_24740 [Serratia liquefaciens]HBL7241640.1 hypothetical protein [Serratia liquefaciens]HDS5480558.1 hypothetical protein [Serratia liquefaciens]
MNKVRTVENTRARIVNAAKTLVDAKAQYAKGDVDDSAALTDAQEQYEELLTAVAAEEMLLLLKK